MVEDPETVRTSEYSGEHKNVLLVVRGDRLDRHPLPRKGQVIIGRSEECDIVIDDPSMSRTHATLRLGPVTTITDAGSANGTFIRDEKIGTGLPTPVAVNEVFELGKVSCVYQRRPLDAKDAYWRPRPSGSHTAVSDCDIPLPDGRKAIVADPAMAELYRFAKRVGTGTIPILILGETGAGKQVLAEAIH